MRVLPFALLFVASSAFAQDTTVTTREVLAPWVPVVTMMASGIISICFLVIAAWLRTYLNVKVDEAQMNTLQTALINAAGKMIQAYGSRVKDRSFDVTDPAYKDAILYVNKAASDAVAHFGLSSADIAEKIEAKLGVLQAKDTI